MCFIHNRYSGPFVWRLRRNGKPESESMLVVMNHPPGLFNFVKRASLKDAWPLPSSHLFALEKPF